MRVYTASIPAKSGKEAGRAPTPFRGRAETRADKSEVKGGQKPENFSDDSDILQHIKSAGDDEKPYA